MSRRRRLRGYHAFFSYSHDHDRNFALALQSGVERFGRSWRRLRVLSVFLDKTRLPAGAALWSSIEDAMSRSGWFVLIASPEAARSRWVARELEWWLEHGPREHLIIVQAHGTLSWDERMGDFARNGEHTALPEVLRGRFDEQPLWVKADWSRAPDRVSEANPDFQDAVATLAAAIHGKPKHELVAQAGREQRRSQRIRRAAVLTLIGLLIAAIGASAVALHQRRVAQHDSQVALSRELAATSAAMSDTNLPVSLLLAVQGLRTADTPQTRAVLMQTDLSNPHLERYLEAGGTISQLAGSADGATVLAGLASGRVESWSLRTGHHAILLKLPKAVTQLCVSGDGSVVAASDGTNAMVWRAGQMPLVVHAPPGQSPDALGLTPSGRILVFHGAPPISGGAESIVILRVADGKMLATHDAPHNGLGTTSSVIADDEDEVLLFDEAYGYWERRQISTWSLLGHSFIGFGAHQVAGAPSSDGRFLTATNGAPTIPVWRTSGASVNDRPARTAAAPISHPNSLALSPDGSHLAVADTGTIYVSATRLPRRPSLTPVELQGNGSVTDVRFFHDSDHLLSSSGEAIAVWNLRQLDRLARRGSIAIGSACEACGSAGLAVSPQGNYVAAVDGNGAAVVLQGLSSGTAAEKIGEDINLDFVLGPPVWEPNGRHVDVPVAPPAGGTSVVPPMHLPKAIRAWTAGDGTEPVVAAGMASDGRDVIVVNARGKIFSQNGRTGAVESTWPGPEQLAIGDRRVAAAAIHTNPELVASVIEGRVVVRALPGDRIVSSIPDTDAEWVAYAGSSLLIQLKEGNLEVWDERGTQHMHTLPGDPSYVFPPVGNAQDTLVARRRSNGSTVVNDLESGTTLAVLPSLDPLGNLRVGVAFGPDGTQIVTITDPERYRQPAALVQRDLSLQNLVQSACRTAGRSLTSAEWRAFVGTSPPVNLSCR